MDRMDPGAAVAQAIEDEIEDDDREPTKEEIMDDLRIALRDVIAGKEMMPALESLEALEKRIYGDANDG